MINVHLYLLDFHILRISQLQWFLTSNNNLSTQKLTPAKRVLNALFTPLIRTHILTDIKIERIEVVPVVPAQCKNIHRFRSETFTQHNTGRTYTRFIYKKEISIIRKMKPHP